MDYHLPALIKYQPILELLTIKAQVSIKINLDQYFKFIAFKYKAKPTSQPSNLVKKTKFWYNIIK